MRNRTKRVNIMGALIWLVSATKAKKSFPCPLVCLCLIAFSITPAAAEPKITFYRDGALLRQEAVGSKGMINIQLPATLLENSLTIVPATGTTIISVETYRAESGKAVDKELETLAEQRRQLEDRLQALETREAIFTSAAKSQSGKAPRKTKANPNPMQTIRQGTDFAIAQLESVYTARRKTNQEIQRIDTRLAAVKKRSRSAGESLRITVAPPRGSVTLRYATAEHGWQPHYNLYLAGDGSAQLKLSARITGSTRGSQVRVSSGSLDESATAETFPARSASVPLASYRLPMTEEQYTGGITNQFSGTITNTSPHYLQPGESGLFRRGTYLGSFVFEGLSSGRSRTVSLGR